MRRVRGRGEGVSAAKAIRGGVVYDLKTFVTMIGIIKVAQHPELVS